MPNEYAPGQAPGNRELSDQRGFSGRVKGTGSGTLAAVVSGSSVTLTLTQEKDMGRQVFKNGRLDRVEHDAQTETLVTTFSIAQETVWWPHLLHQAGGTL